MDCTYAVRSLGIQVCRRGRKEESGRRLEGSKFPFYVVVEGGQVGGAKPKLHPKGRKILKVGPGLAPPLLPAAPGMRGLVNGLNAPYIRCIGTKF